MRNTYNTTVVNNNTTVTRVSFHGGPGGTSARATAQELQAANQRHVSMTSVQRQHQEAARTDRALLASVNQNNGRPDVAASLRPGEFHGRGPLIKGTEASPKPADRGETNRPATNPSATPAKPVTREDRPPSLRPPDATPANPKLEQKQQKEVEKLRQQQDVERQKMQSQHTQERQKLEHNGANQQRQGELQRRQAEQMQSKHAQQSQKQPERQHREQQKEQEKQQQKPPKGGKPSQQ